MTFLQYDEWIGSQKHENLLALAQVRFTLINWIYTEHILEKEVRNYCSIIMTVRNCMNL